MRNTGIKIGLILMVAVMATFSIHPPKAIAQEKAALSLVILNAGYNLEVKAGKDNHFSLEVRNVGITTMDNIRLSSDMVGGWDIEFNPVEIPSLSPGNVQIVDVNIKPSSNLSEKVHYIRIFATSGTFQTLQSYEIKIKTGPVWLWIVIAIAVVVIAAFLLIFLRMGKHK